MTLKHRLRRTVNSLLGKAGFQIVRSYENRAVKDFLPFEETLEKAEASGLSLCDYIDKAHNVPGATQETIDRMAELGVFDGPIERVCEIGAGSGRFLEKTLERCEPGSYEVYETAPDWSKWLAETYPVVAHPADGETLAFTPDRSVDLVHAHKVYVYVPFVTSCRYFDEMARVVKDGGHAVFDIVTEACMDDETIRAWIDSGLRYPCLMPRGLALQTLARRGLKLKGSFFIPMRPGRTECFVLQRPV